MNKRNSIFIIGGGIAGLSNAILLSRAGFEVTLAERKTFPFHKVCGEYVSNEVISFVSSLGFHPSELNAANINKLIVSAPSGKNLHAKLDMGGFGISRYALDFKLYELAKAAGVHFVLGEKINNVIFEKEQFFIQGTQQNYQAEIVIGGYGKRSNLDQKLNRSFFYKRSPYIGVKYHIQSDFPKNTIRLDNFDGGYCGLNKIEDDLYCLCYLSENKHLKTYGNIPEMEKEVLMKNPFLKDVFQNAEFVWPQPETINQIAFEKKPLIENHILMCGDTAGMIAPLCGNGMAMAFYSAKLLSNCIIQHAAAPLNPQTRLRLENSYQLNWNKAFAGRLHKGRTIQKLFGKPWLSEICVNGLKHCPSLLHFLIRQTHGDIF